MKIVVTGETELMAAPAEALEIEERNEGHFGPLPMLAASLATCSLAVLWSWGDGVELDRSGLEVWVRWSYEEDPYRVGRFELEVRWPALPEDRRERARRVVETCTVHHTLEHPPEMATTFGG